MTFLLAAGQRQQTRQNGVCVCVFCAKTRVSFIPSSYPIYSFDLLSREFYLFIFHFQFLVCFSFYRETQTKYLSDCWKKKTQKVVALKKSLKEYENESRKICFFFRFRGKMTFLFISFIFKFSTPFSQKWNCRPPPPRVSIFHKVLHKVDEGEGGGRMVNEKQHFFFFCQV